MQWKEKKKLSSLFVHLKHKKKSEHFSSIRRVVFNLFPVKLFLKHFFEPRKTQQRAENSKAEACLPRAHIAVLLRWERDSTIYCVERCLASTTCINSVLTARGTGAEVGRFQQMKSQSLAVTGKLPVFRQMCKKNYDDIHSLFHFPQGSL